MIKMNTVGGSLERQLDWKTFFNIHCLIQVNLVKMTKLNYLIKIVLNNRQSKVKQLIIKRKIKYSQS